MQTSHTARSATVINYLLKSSCQRASASAFELQFPLVHVFAGRACVRSHVSVRVSLPPAHAHGSSVKKACA